ncbi:hypothetical protein INS49_001016 [Diaporthe citri]|uniref:uncharacterized protein n=1 Tax=Diaporthe citri TaxID=83186 RepID=UPI001C7F51E3|nr:uncharacterized protein INS49_001016 [Diaporthe citri]KAG6366835.1 hypothetical protein INS49_001016 [Diaporthe citri]
MQQADMGRDSNGLGPDVLRGISLQELDKRAQGHEDPVSLYLGWLQEHLNDWDLSDSAAFRPQIESWYASLRFRGYDDQRVRDAFAAWMSNQVQNDASCARRFLVVQEELLSILGGDQTIQPRDLGMDQGITGVITVKEDKIIDVSSGDGDSDVEFLGWKRPDNMRSASKSARHTFPPLTGANKETQLMQGTECAEPNDGLKGSKARKRAPSRIPSGKPPKGYVCGRCGEKGHFKEQCPTNLDPSLDPKPTGGYQCYCCGAKEKHLTTLCPLNENPNSLTQQRIKAGVTLSDSSPPPRGADHYRPRKAKKTLTRTMDSAPTYGNRRALGHFEDDDDHRMDPGRLAWLERDDRGRSSPQSDDRMKGMERSHYSPSREKRGRRPSIEESHRTKRTRRWRERPRGDSQSSQSEREESAELMPRVGHHNSGDGRLSYWDDGYNDVKMSSALFSEESRRSVPTVHHPSDRLEAEIQRLYPDAHAAWICDMASFDVNDFFRRLEDYHSAAGTIQIEEDARMEMNIFDDEDKGHALPTVRLPPAQNACTDAISDAQMFAHAHQYRSSLDDTPRTNDNEEHGWDGSQKGDKDRKPHDHNSEIVVKLPQGTRAALDMDSFSAQLKVDSPPPDGSSPERDP